MAGASFLLGEMQEVDAPFGSPWARKTVQTARFGRAVGKIKLTAATAPKFWSFYPLELSRLMKKRSCYGPFFGENQFSPGDEAVLIGLVVQKCHFHVTACAEAHRLAKRAERSLRDLSALWASRRASRAGWTINYISLCSNVLHFVVLYCAYIQNNIVI